jgi:hypothetical protein
MKLHRSILALALALAACGQAPTTTPADTAATATTATSTISTDAAFVPHEEHGPGKESEPNDPASVLVTLDLMRGHLISSLENAKIEDYTFAQQHAIHPFAEHYAQIKSQVQQADVQLDPQLEAAFKKYQQQLETKASLTMLEQGKAEIDAVLNKIELTLVPSHADVHSRALAGVVETAAEEYEESIKDGAFVAPIEYQDAFGFVRSATVRFETIKSKLDADAAQTTQAALTTLAAAMPSITQPQTVVKPASDVTAAAESIEAKLGQAQAAGNDAAAVKEGLTRLAHEVLGTIDAAIDKQDVAAARAGWQAFDAGWGAIEDGVRERSKDSYRTIEEAMGEVEDAVVRTEQPAATDVKAKTSALRSEIDQFINSIN